MQHGSALDAQALAAFARAALYRSAAAGRAHALEEPVHARAAALFWLVGLRHMRLISYEVNHSVSTHSPQLVHKIAFFDARARCAYAD
jgi:hypothetical protein